MAGDASQAVAAPVASRIVARPLPRVQEQDPRGYQINQLRRRYRPKESQVDGETLLAFALKPSDPDFAFDVTELQCRLYIPGLYPKIAARLQIGNPDIPRGYALNIENGFSMLARERPGATLLELMRDLDNRLEGFLSQEKAETIKLVPNKDTRHLSMATTRIGKSHSQLALPKPQDQISIANQGTDALVESQKNVFTVSQKAEALARRTMETRQLEARMGRLALYRKLDEIRYTLPIDPRKRSDLPIAMQSIKTVELIVPLLYPLENCQITLNGITAEESFNTEREFAKRVQDHCNLNLMNHVNYLVQNMHSMTRKQEAPADIESLLAEAKTPSSPKTAPQRGLDLNKNESAADTVEPHNHSRPPEWDESDSEDANDTDSYDTGDESEADNTEQAPETATTTTIPEKGTAISFPDIEMYGIEVLELVTAHISVRCARCKELNDIKDLHDGGRKTASCRKCATQMFATFRRELIHAGSVRGGYFDLEGCMIADLLPSTFIPSCSSCSTPFPQPGITTIRGETISNVCRECHQRFTLHLPSIRFLRITHSAPARTETRRRKKEVLGLVPGTPLPNRGRCRHYAKSYRWFRFGCCARVYSCDRCHDASEEHAHEWATRMICGWCSREQHYRPADCAMCHGGLVGRKAGGFWEGGKGTRDRVRMSRKDKRKFRRPGGTNRA